MHLSPSCNLHRSAQIIAVIHRRRKLVMIGGRNGPCVSGGVRWQYKKWLINPNMGVQGAKPPGGLGFLRRIAANVVFLGPF